MQNKNLIQISNEPLLLKRFNNREEVAFTEIYQLYYYEFFILTLKLFNEGKEFSEDIVQDIFIGIWNNKNRCFDSIEGLKLYIYVSIKNKLRDHAKHKKHVEQYKKIIKSEDLFTIEIAETEVYSVIVKSINLLPEECANVFKLHIDGWSVKEIAEKLQKTESTVYKQKTQAITILKNKLTKNQLIIITIMLS